MSHSSKIGAALDHQERGPDLSPPNIPRGLVHHITPTWLAYSVHIAPRYTNMGECCYLNTLHVCVDIRASKSLNVKRCSSFQSLTSLSDLLGAMPPSAGGE